VFACSLVHHHCITDIRAYQSVASQLKGQSKFYYLDYIQNDSTFDEFYPVNEVHIRAYIISRDTQGVLLRERTILHYQKLGLDASLLSEFVRYALSVHIYIS